MKNLYSDTIIAPATIPGTGAISIVRISGPDAFSLADRVVCLKEGTVADAQGYTIHYGSVYDSGKLLDEVLVSVFRAPAVWPNLENSPAVHSLMVRWI